MRRSLSSIVWLAAVPIGTAAAQSASPSAIPSASPTPSSPRSSPPRTYSVRADNDAFDFWMRPWNRPDEEYTSGVHLDYDGGSAPRWAQRLMTQRPVCVVNAETCQSGRLEIGQDIYTAAVTRRHPVAPSTARPSAGWLYLQQTARALTTNQSDELSLTVGVTGPPSLARFTQQLAHDAAPKFNRPTDWSRQIGFEPGVIARYTKQRRLSLISNVADVIPTASVSVGNVLTAAEAGFSVRSGWNLPHPWLPERASTGFFIDAGISGQAVAHNLFLDGNTFSASPRVGHEPFVGTGHLGLGLRVHALSLEYRAVNQTRAYSAGPKWHPWASMVGSITVGG